MRYLMFVLFITRMFSLSAQILAHPKCLPDQEYAPTLIRNLDNKVSFHCTQATAFDLIRAVGYQTRLPIGIIFGADLNALSSSERTYNLSEVDASAALAEATSNTGFSVVEEHGTFHLAASDLTEHQKSLLNHKFPNFALGPREMMLFQGAMLTTSLRNLVDPTRGTGGSIPHATNEETFTLRTKPNATTTEIADQIVNQGSKGMWVFKAGALPSSDVSTIDVEIWPYQHFPNAP